MLNTLCPIQQLIEIVKRKLDRKFDPNGWQSYLAGHNYMLYISKDEKLNERSNFLVGMSIELDRDFNEIYPAEATINHLEKYYPNVSIRNVTDLMNKTCTSN